MADTKKKIAKADMDAAIAATEAKYGDLPKGLLKQFADVESRYGELLYNDSGARGPWQFMEPTGKQYGLNTEQDRLDPYKSADAAARLLRDNKRDLEKRIGRPVTNGELYLAHQQGAAGAAKLLKDPKANAAAVVGAERVRQNLPKERQAEHTKLTTGDFAKLWTSKFDGVAPAPKPGTTPAKKPEPQAVSLLGAPPQTQTRADFFTYNPNRLEELKQSNEQRMANKPVPKAAIKPVAKLQGSLLAQAPEEVATGEAKPVVPTDRKSTAILQGLSVYEKSMQRLAPELLNIEAAEAPVTAPEGVAGTFSRGVDSGLANAAADREYFGAIIDSITGQPDKAAGRIRDARLREDEADHHVAGMETFQEFLQEPSFDGFFGQVVRSMGEVAPSAVETVVGALATGGTYSFAKLGLSQGAKVVAKTLIKDLVTKKAKGEALDAAEDTLLDAMYKDFKRGAVAGAFGQEYVPAAGGAFSEFGDAGQEMGSDQALMSLGIAIPQAALGVGGETVILKGLAGLALKKSTREAGDSVLKRFAADVSAAALKSGATEGITEVGQEAISVAQRAAIDPEFTGEDALLRVAQAAFSGFFGGAGLGGGGAIPAAGVGAVRRSTVGDKINNITKRAKSIVKDASDSRVEAEVNAEVKGVDDDAVMTGKTAPESLQTLASQIEQMKNPTSPKKAVWASEQQDIGLAGMIPGEVSSFEEDGKTMYVANLPGHGNLITTEQSIADELMATFNSGGDVKTAIGLALDYKGKPGENVVRAKDKEGNVIHEQTFDEPSRAAAVAKASQIAEAAGGTVDTPSTETALEERQALSDKDSAQTKAEQAALRAMDNFLQTVPEDEIETADVKYARGKQGAGTVEQTRVAAEESFAGVSHLFKNGALRVEDKPTKGIDPEAQAVTDEDGIVTIYAANTSPEQVRGLVLHEVGAHVGMRKIMGEAEFDRLLGDFAHRMWGGLPPISVLSGMSPEVRKRIDTRARADDGGGPLDKDIAAIWSGMSARDRASPHALEEVLGHFLEQAKDGPLLTRIITRLKLWLRKNAPALFKGNKPLTDAEILEIAKAAVRAEINAAKKYTVAKAKTLKEKVAGKGQPDAEGFITSAEKALADPAPRFKDAKRLTADQWRKFFRDSGATKEAFKYQIEPALEGIKAAKDGKITRAQIEEGLHTNRVTMEGNVERNAQMYSNYVATGAYTNYMQRVFRVTAEAMKRFIGNDAFESHNWDKTNPVIHIRTTDRVTTNGEQVKFVEELQSDAHQEGASKGYKDGTPPPKPVDHHLEKLGLAYDTARVRLEEFLRSVGADNSHAMERGVSYYLGRNRYSKLPKTVAGKVLSTEEYAKYADLDSVYHDASDEYENYTESLRDEAFFERQDNPVARMPMEAWEGPAIERALLEGVKSGIDLVAFTNEKTLHRSLRNDGTKLFYGQRVPATLAKIAKRLGVKVETVELSTAREDITAEAARVKEVIMILRTDESDGFSKPGMFYAEYFDGPDQDGRYDEPNGDGTGMRQTRAFATTAEARNAAEAAIDANLAKALKNLRVDVLAVRLSEGAKRKLREGVVMYSRPGEVTVDDDGEPTLLNTEKGGALLDEAVKAAETDTSYEGLKQLRNNLRKKAADSLKVPKPTPKTDLTPAEIHAAHDRHDAEVKRRVSIERAVSLLNDAIDAHEIMLEDGKPSADLQRVVERRAKSAAAELRSTIAKPDEDLTVKKMTVDDDGEATVEDEADTVNDTTDLETQLNDRYAELDAANATRIEQFNEREAKRTPDEEKEHQSKIDAAWLKLAQFTPDEEQFANYTKYKDRMPLEMIEKLTKLNEANDDDGARAYYDVASDATDAQGKAIPGAKGKLSITQRDADPKSETVVTRDAVRAFLNTIKGWSKSTRFNGAAQWVNGPKGPEAKSMGGSFFWVVNRRTGKAMRLNGTPPAKGQTGLGQQGLGVMARAGVKLNAQTDQGLGGDGLTVAQKYAQGLMTMMKALAEAGYDLHYGNREDNTKPFINPRKLPDGPASEIALVTKKGRAYTLPELLGVKAPFETSKSDFDAGENTEQLSEFNTVSVTVSEKEKGNDRADAPRTRQVTQDIMTDANFGQQEDRALAEAKQKKQGGFDAEEKDHKEGSAQKRTRAQEKQARKEGKGLKGPKVETARDAELNANRRERAIVDEAIERDMTEMAEEKLRDIPTDVTLVIRKNKGMYQATLNSERFPRGNNVVESETLDGVVARAHAKANSQPQSRANRYDRIGLEDAVHNTQHARETINEEGKADPKIPEISGVPAAKDQKSLKDGAKVTVLGNANQLTVFGKLGPMTNRLLGIALSKFTLERPLTVMTLSHLKENFDKLTAPGAPYAGAKARDILAQTIADMENENEPGRVIMGNKNLIILRNEPRLGNKPDGSPNLAPDDAAIAAVLAHEIGHIVFKIEFERNIKQGPEKSILWNAYVKQVKSMAQVPSDYTETKDGFEEWFSDQVMAWAYKKSGESAKNATDSIFKRIADKFRDFFDRVNAELKGRLQINWTFNSYMKDVVRRHAVNRKLNNDVPVATEMLIKKMSLAAQLGSVANRVRNRAQNGTTMKKMVHKAQNLLAASVDFMGLDAHGTGGKNLRKFFGTESQSQDKMGWNKRKLFTEARFANDFAKIFGFNEKTDGKEWRSQRVTDILNEAEDNDIDTANLSTPEAVKVRELFEKLYDDYLIDPTTGKTWFGNIWKMKNYGGPRMFNADKINQDPEAFVRWLQAHPTWGSDPVTTNAAGKPVSRAHGVVAKIIGKIGEPIGIIEAEIDLEVAQGTLSATMTPSERAAEIFARSAEDRAVMEAKNKILRDAEKGNQGFTMQDLLNDVLAISQRNASNLTQAFTTLNGVRTATDPKVIKQALDKFWMETTRETRLTPGMDPALSRTLPKIPTKDFRSATPGDPNGWLLPQAVAIQQYFHFATRKVEYAKMGGFDYIDGQLDAIPEEYRDDVDAAIMANLGKFGENMSNKWRLFNSAAAVATVFTTLLFTTLSSVTDFAGIAIRSKDFRNLGTYFSVLKKTMTDRDYAELARSVGTVVGRAQDHAMIGLGELDHANRTSRAIMDGFFRYTGLEFFTRFSRTVATGMGKEFILNTANRADFGVHEERLLAELGLTRDDVRSWERDNFSFETPDGMLVRDAIARFADESIIRPDASQRPTWASNPYYSVIWHLKSYYYGFGKTVIGGLIRETKNRYDETGGDIGKAAAVPALLAVTIIPLTMLGLGSREWAKWLFQLAIPGVDETVFRTSYMDFGEYSWEIFKRSGVMGPFALALTTLEAFEFEGIAAPFTANIPLVDMFDDSVFDGDGARLLPVVNNIK